MDVKASERCEIGTQGGSCDAHDTEQGNHDIFSISIPTRPFSSPRYKARLGTLRFMNGSLGQKMARERERGGVSLRS